MADLVLMAGAPGSGKTTLAQKLVGERDTYISRDDIRFSMITEKDIYFSKEVQVLSTFVKQVDDALLKTERYVFADATHLTRGSRAKLLNNLKNKPDHIYVILFDVPLETALERNKQRKARKLVPEPIVRNMHRSIEIPRHDEGIDATFIVDETGNIDFNRTIVYGKGDGINDLFN